MLQEEIIPLNTSTEVFPITAPVSGFINILWINTSLFKKEGFAALVPLSRVADFNSSESNSIVTATEVSVGTELSSESLPVVSSVIVLFASPNAEITKVSEELPVEKFPEF